MVLGGSREVGKFSFVGVALGHGVDGFRWFSGSWEIFLCRGLLWGTVWMVLGGFRGVGKFSFVRGCFGARCGWF
jgi:hypothetical protein